MLRFPQIIPLADRKFTDSGGIIDTPAARFIVLMEMDDGNGRPMQMVVGQPGPIYREDVIIPWRHRNDAKYIARQMRIAWQRIENAAPELEPVEK